MKVLEQNVGVLTNAEVLKVLADRGASIASTASKALASEKLVYQYLAGQAASQTEPEQASAFISSIESLGLSRGEALQVLNTLPRTPVEVHLLLTNCEERLGEPGTDALLNAVNEFLPQPLPAQEQQEVQAEE